MRMPIVNDNAAKLIVSPANLPLDVIGFAKICAMVVACASNGVTYAK